MNRFCWRSLCVLILLTGAIMAVACTQQQATPTPLAPTSTATVAPIQPTTKTPTVALPPEPIFTAIPVPTLIPTAIPTPTLTAALTPTMTPPATPTSTPTPTATLVPTPTPIAPPTTSPTIAPATPQPQETHSDSATAKSRQAIVDAMVSLTRNLSFYDLLATLKLSLEELLELSLEELLPIDEQTARRAALDLDTGPGEAFDVNQYFSVLPLLSKEQGFKLDYVYFFPGGTGVPILYARRESDSLDTQSRRYEYLDHIQTDGSADGFFQFVVFKLLADRFYLFWHAVLGDVTIICTREALEELLSHNKLPADVQQAARALPLEPIVEFDGDKVIVTVVTFSGWGRGGFKRQAFTITRNFPHKILQEESETLVPYEGPIT